MVLYLDFLESAKKFGLISQTGTEQVKVLYKIYLVLIKTRQEIHVIASSSNLINQSYSAEKNEFWQDLFQWCNLGVVRGREGGCISTQ